MKKLLITVTALLLAGAGYFTYDKWVKHSDLTAWSFVPSDAAIVLDLRLNNDLEDLEANPVWQNLLQTDGLNAVRTGLAFLDSINGDGGFTAVFRDMPTLISTHKVSSSSLDFLFVLDIQNLSQNTFVSAAIGRLKKSGIRYKNRNYNGFKISEIEGENKVFTYIFYKNFFLASFTPYLVEDAIRTIEESEVESFKEVHTGERGKVHVNYQQLGNLLGVFSSSKVQLPLSSGSYDLSVDSSMVSLSGFSQADNNWISTHKETPGGFEMAEVIPSNTAVLYHITSSDFGKWETEQLNYLSNEPAIIQFRDSLKTAFDFSAEQVFDLIEDEIGLALLESGRPDDTRKLFILKVKDAQESLSYFQQLAERIAYSRGDSVYSESYSENEIRFLPIQNFPSAILGEMASDFDRCFYFNYRNYLIFSNSLQELKNLVSSTQSEDTWGKSIQMNDFFEKANSEANVSLIVNIPRFWPTLLAQFKPEWASRFKSNQQAYNKIELAAFQFSSLGNQYFTNFTFSQPRKYVRPTAKTTADNSVAFASPPITKPHLVKTHAHNYYDILIQDSTFYLYYFDRTFSSIWTKDLKEPVKGEIFEMDYYKNGKIQYAFATGGKIHIIDRTGAYIPGYPKAIAKAAKTSFFNLIDYERSRNYRMGITDVDGKVYLTDKDMNVLEGWDPIPYKRPAISPLRHARLGRRDVMISIQENGILNITNRRGIRQAGFPFDLKADVGGSYYLNASNSLGRSSLTILSRQGELVEINLEGIVIARDQLVKQSQETTFELVEDRGRNSFIILRKVGNQYDVLDATGNLLFSKDYLSGSEVLVQFYQFGAGKDLILFTDRANESLYIFDRSGNLVTGNPLRSSNEVSLIYSSSKKELQIYTTSGTNLEFYEFDY
ncbi:MAG: hypothetical protein RIM99_19245 [Cyclobacteriaceae bacterium]